MVANESVAEKTIIHEYISNESYMNGYDIDNKHYGKGIAITPNK
jgi:hypothetical protein